jgi:hypothetical protein
MHAKQKTKKISRKGAKAQREEGERPALSKR